MSRKEQRWEISKEFDFCYGHRVWSQNLDIKYSLDPCLKCRHLHGHQAKIIIYLSSNVLKDGMVTDFSHLNWFKKFLEVVLDHKFLLDISDPLFSKLVPDILKNTLVDKNENYKVVDLRPFENDKLLKELYESFIIVDFVPTSENISTWLLEIVAKKMQGLDVRVSKIKFFETPKSQSCVYA